MAEIVDKYFFANFQGLLGPQMVGNVFKNTENANHLALAVMHRQAIDVNPPLFTVFKSLGFNDV